MRKGRSLEELVAYLERRYSASESVTVESPKRLKDKTTGRLREHDVVLTFVSGHHTVMIAIECRDRSRPVGVPHVEAFAKKCEETGIGRGAMVSPKSFTKTARTKAERLGINCFSLAQVDTLPWLLCNTFSLFRRRWGQFNIVVMRKGDTTADTTSFRLTTDDGEEVTAEMLRSNLVNVLINRESRFALSNEIGTHRIPAIVNIENLQVVDIETGASEPATHLQVIAEYTNEVEDVPLDFREYRALDNDERLAQLATAQLDFGFAKGQLVINHDLDKGGELVFIRSDKNEA